MLWTDIELLSSMTNQFYGYPPFFVFAFYSFLNLIVTFELYIIYMTKDGDCNVKVMITWLLWITWTSMFAVKERPLNIITDLLIDNQI